VVGSPYGKVSFAKRTRTHLSIDKDAPDARPVQLPAMGMVIEIAKVGGLHHRYDGEQHDENQ
jgi:hypothetical protein